MGIHLCIINDDVDDKYGWVLVVPGKFHGILGLGIFVEPLSGFPEFAATPDTTGFSASSVLEEGGHC
jgi:hypothetical protein